MGRAPLALPAAAFVAGILLERVQGALLPALVLAVLAIAAARTAYRSPIVAVAACAFALGLLDGAYHGHPRSVDSASPRIAVWGTVVSDVRRSALGAQTFVAALDGSFSVRVTIAHASVMPGERVELRGRIEPLDEARNPGEPSPRELAADDGIAAEMTHVTLLARAPPAMHDIRTWMPRARAWASSALRQHLAEPYASILAGALWGEKSTLAPQLRAEFQTTGTVHVLVTAGLHLGVVAALALWIMSTGGVARAPAALAALAIVWCYVWFSGAHLPSLRAAAMASVVLGARACGARAVSWNTFAAALLVVAGAWPSSVMSASFALSFSCVAAIFAFAEPIGALLERIPRLPAPAREALALTIATQIGVWPLTAAVFLIVAPYAPLANLGVVPAVGLAMTLGLAQLAAAPIAPLADALARLDAWILAWIVFVVQAVSALPHARIDVAPPAWWQIVAYDIGAAATAFCLHGGRMRRAAVCATVGLAFVLLPHGTRRGTLTITAIDVGQADALLVTTPGGHAFLIDAGGKLERGSSEDGGSPAEDVGERIVVPYLLRAGITSLDGIIMTHPHGDHVGGVAPVLRHLRVGWLADSGQIYGGHAYRDALDEAGRRRVELREPRRGDVWRTDDGVTLRFLAPSEPYFACGTNDVNENSIVFMLEYRGFRALFMGDAGAQSEQRLLASGADLHADLLKVGHHGSAYSSTPQFIAAVAPSTAIVSVGRHNLFGHPAASTLRTLQATGTAIYRTDRCGALTIRLEAGLPATPQLPTGCRE